MAWATMALAVTGDIATSSEDNIKRANILESMAAKVTTAGDVAYATAANALARLALGTAGYPLVAGASAPSWATIGDTGLAAQALWGKVPPVASVRRNATQSINDSAWTAISFDTETYDTDSMFAPTSTTITIVTGGIYLCCAQVFFAAHDTGYRGIRLTGFADGAIVQVPSIVGGAQTGIATVLCDPMTPSNTVTVEVWQNSGGALNITSANVSVVRLA